MLNLTPADLVADCDKLLPAGTGGTLGLAEGGDKLLWGRAATPGIGYAHLSPDDGDLNAVWDK